ncbi:Fatty acid metabolism regulator protein [Bienertia sinuspersici]
MMMKLLTQLLGAPKLVDYKAPDGFSESPLVKGITNVRIPKKLDIPAFPRWYDKMLDTHDHVASYIQRMWQLSIPWKLIKPTMCKSFGASLARHTLQWLVNLRTCSINNFSSLVNKFYQQFAPNKVQCDIRRTKDLWINLLSCKEDS